MKHLIMNCVSEICEYEIRMPLLPLAGQPCPQQVSSNYANVAKYIQYIFKVQYITYHWQMFLGASAALSRYLPAMQMRPKLYI